MPGNTLDRRDRPPLVAAAFADPPGGPPEPDDAHLVARVKAGDEAALSVLYRRYVRPIHRFVLAQMRDPDEAEDLTSDTFTRMIQGIGDFRGEASFKNWLYQIARNAVRNHRRSAGYRRTGPLTPALAGGDAEPDADRFELEPDDAAADAAWDAALALLRPLPPRYRKVLELRFVNGCTIGETAARMGITEANAKVLQHRALKKAAVILEEQHVEHG